MHVRVLGGRDNLPALCKGTLPRYSFCILFGSPLLQRGDYAAASRYTTVHYVKGYVSLVQCLRRELRDG